MTDSARIIDDYNAKLAANRLLPCDEFVTRFKARMIQIAGEQFDDGSSIAEYADEVGPTYWDDKDQREDGPECCADTDVSYWGE